MTASRLHHTAYVTKDLQATRRFYEELLGFPLQATWCEADELFGKLRVYCHCFFGLEDGSALAFFQFADPEDQAEFGPPIPPSPFIHIALTVTPEAQAAVQQRLTAAGYEHPRTYILEHGYCRSLYVEDPNGMIVELTADTPSAVTAEVIAANKAKAHRELERWLAGDHTSNNSYR
jgi:catechol 2,3-dioxygenase-like lactoylglutathione lyase family enzyme